MIKNEVIIPKGTGYWALGLYPWGGDFHRLDKDYKGKITKVISRYNNGEPSKIIVTLPDGSQAGFEL